MKLALVARELGPIRKNRRPPLTVICGLTVAVILLGACSSDSTPVAERTPLDVTELFRERFLEGDFSGLADLNTPEATWQVLAPGGDSPVIRLADELPSNVNVADWDGDGAKTEGDFFSSLGAEAYSGGITDILSCEQPDTQTAVCEETREGYAFQNPSHSATWTITIADGLISSVVIDLTGDGVDAGKVTQYKTWVEANRADAADGLFGSFGERIVTPDNIETHRQLATEWLATQ